MERETVFFSEGIPLLATLGYPDQGEGPFPGIVIFHGHARHRNDGLDALSRRLNEAGYVTLRFDFRGCGETLYGRYNIICHAHCPEDALNAVSFLMMQPEVDKNRIGVTGESLGGCTTVYAAGIDKRVRCAVSMAGLGDPARNLKRKLDRRYGPARYKQILEQIEADRYERVKTGHSKWILSSGVGDATVDEGYEIAAANTLDRVWGSANSNYMTLDSLESLLKYRPLDVCHQITIPILFLHGAQDELVDPDEGQSLCDAVASQIKEFRLLEGLDHNMPIHPNRQRMFDLVVDWFDRYL